MLSYTLLLTLWQVVLIYIMSWVLNLFVKTSHLHLIDSEMSHIMALYKYSARTVNILNSSIIVLQISIKINYKRLLLGIITFLTPSFISRTAFWSWLSILFFYNDQFYMTVTQPTESCIECQRHKTYRYLPYRNLNYKA